MNSKEKRRMLLAFTADFNSAFGKPAVQRNARKRAKLLEGIKQMESIVRESDDRELQEHSRELIDLAEAEHSRLVRRENALLIESQAKGESNG